MKSNWEIKKLEEICENLDSKRIPITQKDRNEGKYPYYGASGIVDYVDNFIFDENLLLVSEDGANLLARTYPIAFSVSGKVWVNNHAHVLKFDKVDTQRFIEYYLNSIKLDNYVGGMAQPKLNQKSLNSIVVPLPPLPEQQRLVTILDEAYAAITKAKENTEKNLQNVRNLFEYYRENVFILRGDGWMEQPLGELATFRNGINFTKTSRGESVKIVGVKDFQKNFWAPLDNLDTVITEGTLPEPDRLKENDLLFVRSNGNLELIGRSLLIGKVNDHITHSGFTIRARLNGSDVKPQYLCHFLKSNNARQKMIDSGIGTNIKSLNQTTLSSLIIPFPSSVEQSSIVDQLEAMDTETKKLETIYKQKLLVLEELKQSILQKAFSGELAAPQFIQQEMVWA